MQNMGQHDTILLINFDIHVGVMCCVLSSKIMKHCHLWLNCASGAWHIIYMATWFM